MTDDKIVFSDDECGESWSDVKDFRLPFGKYKDIELASIICSKTGRDYLNYLLKWDKLYDKTRSKIKCALDHYCRLKRNRR
jgi:hypothetical protein